MSFTTQKSMRSIFVVSVGGQTDGRDYYNLLYFNCFITKSLVTYNTMKSKHVYSSGCRDKDVFILISIKLLLFYFILKNLHPSHQNMTFRSMLVLCTCSDIVSQNNEYFQLLCHSISQMMQFKVGIMQFNFFVFQRDKILIKIHTCVEKLSILSQQDFLLINISQF